MLSFTQSAQSKKGAFGQLDFQPLVISNQPQQPFPHNPQKKILKAVSNSRSQERSKGKRQAPIRDKNIHLGGGEEREGWVSSGKVEVFDKNLRKNALAEEQRRIRAELKKQKVQTVKQLTRNEKNIRVKALELQKAQQTEIVQLERLIQREREQKAKNDRAYQQRLKQIEKERGDLMKLERKIQEHGVRHPKAYKQEMGVLVKNEYPTNDRAKCHQEVRRSEQQGGQLEISESEGNHQRQMMRQKQLELLMQQRERCMQNQTTFGYNPTIIPLLSRASYKIISTHVSTLIELLVDDLLEEQVYMLEEIELKEKLVQEQEREKNVINDYCQKLEEFVDEAEAIEGKVGRYSALKFQDLYFPKHFPRYQSNFQKSSVVMANLYGLEGLQGDVLEEVESRRERFVRFIGNFDEYKKGNLVMFEKVTEELIDEAIGRLAQELDRGSSEFVQNVFRKEFQ